MASSQWWKWRVAPRRARRPSVKARGVRMSATCERRATTSDGMHRPSNAAPLPPRAALIRTAAALALAGGFVVAGFTAGVRGDGAPRAGATDWPMWGGTPSRNMVSAATGLPDKWDVKTKANVKWVADLG